MPRTGSVCAMQQAADNMHHPCDTRRAECAMCNGAYAQVRDKENGWLRGFITVTTFTTWHNDFRWDSLAPQSGMDDHCGTPSCRARKTTRTHARTHGRTHARMHGRACASRTFSTCAAPRVRRDCCVAHAALGAHYRSPHACDTAGTLTANLRGRHAVRRGRQPREAAELAGLLREPAGCPVLPPKAPWLRGANKTAREGAGTVPPLRRTRGGWAVRCGCRGACPAERPFPLHVGCVACCKLQVEGIVWAHTHIYTEI